MNMTTVDLIDLINQLLNLVRTRYGLTSDEKLAQRLGVSSMAIYRWRRGQIDKSTRVLLPLVLHHADDIRQQFPLALNQSDDICQQL